MNYSTYRNVLFRISFNCCECKSRTCYCTVYETDVIYKYPFHSLAIYVVLRIKL
nr:MAG TPA: hypothetical protein [Bacteriophage sp.]